MRRASIVVIDKHGNRVDLVDLHCRVHETPATVINPHLIGKEEAVARCGISMKQFDALVKEGIFPPRLPRTQLWNRKKLYECLEIRKLLTDKVEPGWVYFMEMGDFVKIGWSTWPASRRDTLQTSCPYDIKILGAFPGSIGNEAGLHTLFSHLRARGEWFRKSPGLLAYIAWLKVAWRGNANVIPGDLDNVIAMTPSGKSVD